MDFKDVIDLGLWFFALMHVCAVGWYDFKDNDNKVIKHAALACMMILILQGAS